MRGPLAVLCFAASCAQPPSAYRVELALGFEDAVTWRLRALSIASDEADVCSATCVPAVAPTDENTVIDVGFSGATQEIHVPAGRYLFSVDGFDGDGVEVARGCGDASIGASETQDVEIGVCPVEPGAVCGDGTRGRLEQCDDGGIAPGDGCNESCETEEAQFNTRVDLSQLRPAAAAGAQFVGAFESGGALHFRALDSAGRPFGGGAFNDQPVREGDACADGCDDPAVGAAGPGLVVAYTVVDNLGGGALERDVRFSVYASTAEGAEPVDGLAGVAAGPQADRVPQAGAAAAMQDDGSFAVAWLEGAPEADSAVPGTPWVRAFDADGAPRGPAAPLADDGMTDRVVLAAVGDGYVAAWTREGARFRRLDASAAPLGDGMLASIDTAATDVAIGASDAGFALAWIERPAGESEVAVRAFDATGAARGTPRVVSPEGGGDDLTPAVAGGRGYFVVWEAGGDVLGRYLGADGAPAPGPMSAGPAFDVSVSNDGRQRVPAIAMAGDLAIVLWEDAGREPPREDTSDGIRYRFLVESGAAAR